MSKANTCTGTHMHTHARTHARARAHTHTHTHTHTQYSMHSVSILKLRSFRLGPDARIGETWTAENIGLKQMRPATKCCSLKCSCARLQPDSYVLFLDIPCHLPAFAVFHSAFSNAMPVFCGHCMLNTCWILFGFFRLSSPVLSLCFF